MRHKSTADELREYRSEMYLSTGPLGLLLLKAAGELDRLNGQASAPESDDYLPFEFDFVTARKAVGDIE